MGWAGLELYNMEETKLLRLLILIVSHFISMTVFAEKSDLEWAKDLTLNSQEVGIKNLQEMMQMSDFDKDLRDSILKPRPVLQVFVSSSMPKKLLKSYAKEASKYGGVLVFRGLPDGSFRTMTNVVMDISDDDTQASMQIDDEAFKGFDIKIVPTIVLSKPESMFSKQIKSGRFDKISGNVTIKYALESFAENGDLAIEAKGVLK